MTLARVCALGLLLLGCDANRELREHETVAHLCWAEERLRSAANAEKELLLADLAQTPCPVAEACAARDKCSSGYTLHVDALKLTAVAKQNMADGQAEQAAKLLGAAEEKLKASRMRIDECTASMAALRRAYSVDR